MMKAKKNGSIINVASKAGSSGAAAGVVYTSLKQLILEDSASAWLHVCLFFVH